MIEIEKRSKEEGSITTEDDLPGYAFQSLQKAYLPLKKGYEHISIFRCSSFLIIIISNAEIERISGFQLLQNQKAFDLPNQSQVHHWYKIQHLSAPLQTRKTEEEPQPIWKDHFSL